MSPRALAWWAELARLVARVLCCGVYLLAGWALYLTFVGR